LTALIHSGGGPDECMDIFTPVIRYKTFSSSLAV
jgi:hypothetical protein